MKACIGKEYASTSSEILAINTAFQDPNVYISEFIQVVNKVKTQSYAALRCCKTERAAKLSWSSDNINRSICKTTSPWR